jgi:hypothetical protein
MSKQKPTKWNWNHRRLLAAKLIATTTLTHEEIAKKCSVNRSTVSEWNMHHEFKEKVTELVLLDERATKAGILRRALNTLEEKSLKAADDKTTELDYLKFVSDLVGLTDKKEGVNVFNVTGIVHSPEVIQAANDLVRRLSEKTIEMEDIENAEQ